MTNLYDSERHRLKLYGQMLREDHAKLKELQKIEKEEKLKQDSLELQTHIQNTRKYQQAKKYEQRQINKIVENDNKKLTTLKRSIHIPHTYAEEGSNFMHDLQQMNTSRLDRVKRQLDYQVNENQHQLAVSFLLLQNRKQIQEKIRQIEQIEEQRHTNRIKEMQMESLRNRQETKRKYQQDMTFYDKHKRLLEQNQHYKDQLQSFTQGNSSILDRYNRNDYSQRKNNQIENQSAIKQQMIDLERRKSQEMFDYKKSIGDLEHSMLRSVLVKPQNNDFVSYNKELKNQMWNESHRKEQQKQAKKEKIQMNNIFGGVHGNERQKMLKFIDKRLGIDQYEKSKLNSSANIPQTSTYEDLNEKRKIRVSYDNPQRNQPPSNQMSRKPSSGKSNMAREASPISQSYHQDVPDDAIQPIQHTHSALDNYNGFDTGRNSEVRDPSRGQKYFRSFDVISGKNKYYGYE